MPFLKDRHKTSRSQMLGNMTKKNGLRHAIFNTVGDRYIGEWNNDLKTGKGALLTCHRQLYEGDFQNGFRHGFGVLAYESESKIFLLEYRGNWRNGRMHGFGLKRYRTGEVYIGDWKNGKRHGYGLMWYLDCSFYAGDWMNDKRHGFGMFVRFDSNRYEGRWQNDLKHGKGRLLHLTTGQMQEGVWIRNDCISSTLKDIRYRQSAVRATRYPIQKVELLNAEELCNERQMRVLLEIVNSCLLVCDSVQSEINQNM